ncbi:PAS domain-containing hybrid sensor histidine kinase/response regulator [Mucilaginibacter gracilis]|uniref:PAS domain-containing hybrid sensor histidine kinase/response regulator n=1 Tax=Mucilaginibacter gracilis TaxID=423350 RepID=UPI0013C32E20|nr:PAS domain-containing hybrid sensor histidine kinase/response regulator [Mucilaginibacter gracilis]
MNLQRLLKSDVDKNLYRFIFIAIGLLNLLLHFLFLSYASLSFDPVAIRIICSFCFLITFLLSFSGQASVFKIGGYFAVVVFLAVNNCYLLGVNNYTGEYFLGSLIGLVVITYTCTKIEELALFILINFVAFAVASRLTTNPVDDIPVKLLTVALFSGLGCMMFLYRRAFIVKYLATREQVNEKDALLTKTSSLLEQNSSKLQSLASSNLNLVFEFNQYKICVNAWCPADDDLAPKVEAMTGKSITHLYIDALPGQIKMALKTLKPSVFEFQSLFGNRVWYRAVVNPLFNDELRFTGSLTLTLTDITEVKKVFNALKESDLVLYNEQVVAKMGSWWTDITGRDISWSNNLFSILEISEIPPERSKLNYYISLIHPEDRDGAQHFFTTLADKPLIEFEHRLTTPKGNLKYLKVVSGYPVQDENGKLIKVVGIIQDITDTKTDILTIKKKQAELAEIQATAKIGGWKWDISLNNLTWSDEVYKIYELDREVVKHEDHIQLFLSFIHPDDRPNIALIFKNYLKIDKEFFEYRIITAAGNLKYLSLIIGKTLINEHGIKSIAGTLQDQSDRKKVDFDFERAENKYKNVLETINMAAVTLNKKGDIVFCNKYLADIAGYDKADLLGMNWIDTFVAEHLKDQFRAWLNSNSFYSQHTSPIICRNGKQRMINWKNTVTYDEFGKIEQTTSIGEDITDIKKAREALIIAKENAEKSSRFKSEFLSIMSHEIRTPMNSVIGTTNLLLQDNPAPRQIEYLHTLRYSSNTLLQLINDILDYNKIEAGKLELYKTPFNIQKMVQNILQSFKTKADDSESLLVLDIDENIPQNLIGDQLRLGQILNNLIGNAVKFTPKGSVTITLSVKQQKTNSVVINFSIKDTGIGIAPQNIDKIFDPFTQEYSSTQSDYGGTGLGLAITKRLVELHNSTINLVSQVGKGTEFSFAIVFEKANVFETDQRTIEGSKPTETNITGMKILLVDDNKMNLLIANKFLKNWHANVDQAINGQIAVEKAMQHNYDIIIMDLQMPVMDGFEAAAIIKQTQPDLPIIALSADAMPETRLKAEQHGMDDYLTKPFVPEILFEKIVKYYKPTVSLPKW